MLFFLASFKYLLIREICFRPLLTNPVFYTERQRLDQGYAARLLFSIFIEIDSRKKQRSYSTRSDNLTSVKICILWWIIKIRFQIFKLFDFIHQDEKLFNKNYEKPGITRRGILEIVFLGMLRIFLLLQLEFFKKKKKIQKYAFKSKLYNFNTFQCQHF